MTAEIDFPQFIIMLDRIFRGSKIKKMIQDPKVYNHASGEAIAYALLHFQKPLNDLATALKKN